MNIDPQTALNALLSGELTVEALLKIAFRQMRDPALLHNVRDFPNLAEFLRAFRACLMRELAAAAAADRTERIIAINKVSLQFDEEIQQFAASLKMLAESEQKAIEDTASQIETTTSGGISEVFG